MQIDERRLGKVHVRHVVLEACAEVALCVGDVVEISQLGESLRDAFGFVGIDACVDPLIRRHLEADDEAAAAAVADFARDFLDETHACFQRATVGVVAGIRPGRQELGDQVAVGAVKLDTVKAAALEPYRNTRERVDESLDIAR